MRLGLGAVGWLLLLVVVLALLPREAEGAAPAGNGTAPVFVWATAGTTNTTLCSGMLAARLKVPLASSQAQLCGWSKECACESLQSAAEQASMLLCSAPSAEVELFKESAGEWTPPVAITKGAVVIAAPGTYGKPLDLDITIHNEHISFVSERGSAMTRIPLRDGAGFLFLETEYEHILSGFTFVGYGEYLVALFYSNLTVHDVVIHKLEASQCLFNAYTLDQTVRFLSVTVEDTVAPALMTAAKCELDWLVVETSSFDVMISAGSVTMSDCAIVSSLMTGAVSVQNGLTDSSISRTVFADIRYNAKFASFAGNIFLSADACDFSLEDTMFANITGFNSLLWITGSHADRSSVISIHDSTFTSNDIVGEAALVVITGVPDVSLSSYNVTMRNNSDTLLVARAYGGIIRLSNFFAEGNACGFSCLRFLPNDLRVATGDSDAVVMIEESSFLKNLGNDINYSLLTLFLRASLFVGSQPEGKDSSLLHMCTRSKCGGVAFIDDTVFESTICSIGSSYITRSSMVNSGFSFAGVTGESRVEISFCTLDDTVIDSGASVAVIVSFCNFTTTGKPPKTFTSPPIPLMAMAKDGGDMWFRSCRFQAFNDVPFSRSYAMVFVGSTVALDNCWIGGFLTSDNGGTIAMNSCTASIADCTFFENHAFTSHGGVLTSTSSNVTIVRSTFRSSSAAVGGAISAHKLSHITVEETEIIEATSGGGGGAIRISDGSTLFVDACLFSRCSSGLGGAILVELESQLSVTNTSFSLCSASDGGAVAVATAPSTSTFRNSTFSACVGSTNGGAIFASLEAAIDVIDCEFSQCEAGTLGAAIALEASTSLNAVGCRFFAGSSGLSGGGLAVTGSANATSSYCVFQENTAGLHGGAIYATAQATVNIVDNQLVGNAAHRGGAIWADDVVSMSVDLSTFANNFALLDAGAAGWSDGATVTVSNCTVESNTAHFRGGGLLLEVSAGGIISNTRFSHNSAALGMGGAMMLSSAGKFLSVSNCAFEDNHASQGGGLALAYCSLEVAFLDNTLSNNVAYAQGGAFYLVSGQLNVRSCTFSANSANTGGTAYLSRNGIAAIEYSLIESSWAVVAGGAFYASPGARLVVTDSTIEDCKADSLGNSAVSLQTAGGAVFASDSSVVSLSLVTLRDCSALLGGAVFVAGYCGPQLLNRALIEENRAVHGGGIFYGPGLLTPQGTMSAINDTLFQGNTADDNGGALYLSDSLTAAPFCNNVTFARNTAVALGGAVYVNSVSSSGFLRYSAFSNNTAMAAGCNVAMQFIRTAETDCLVCDHCDCTFDDCGVGTSGYQDSLGVATAPTYLHVSQSNSCPAGLHLDSESFSVAVNVRDSLGTLVSGPTLKEEKFEVSLELIGSTCYLELANGTVLAPGDVLVAPVMEDTAAASWTFALRAKDNSFCGLHFEDVASKQSLRLAPTSCSIAVSGCPDDDKVVSGERWDSCKEVFLPWQMVVLILILLVLILVALVACSGIVWAEQYRRKALKKKLKNMLIANLEIVDVNLMQSSPLAALLADKDIEFIPWENIHVEERIGIGANAIVSRAWLEDEETGELSEVAVKELVLRLEQIPLEEQRRFAEEIKFTSALAHKNIVKFYGVSYSDAFQKLYLVTELMEQGSLKDLLQRKGKNVPVHLMLQLMLGAAKGMAYLHANNIIHRDVKAQNALVDDEWHCKISDFGISTVQDQTRTMTCIGTPLYMAPEVLTSARYTEKADIYSFGILLVEAFLADDPYREVREGLNDAQLLFRIVRDKLRPSVAGLPAGVQEIVEDCISEEPEDRPCFDEVVARLKRLYRIAFQEANIGVLASPSRLASPARNDY